MGRDLEYRSGYKLTCQVHFSLIFFKLKHLTKNADIFRLNFLNGLSHTKGGECQELREKIARALGKRK